MQFSRKQVLVAMILGAGLASAGVRAGEGGATGVGGGGDAYALEFVSMGRGSLGYLRAYADQFPEVTVAQLTSVIESTQVASVDQTFLEDERGRREVDAINYPDVGKIEISRSRWAQLGADEKITLVFHEYLGILRQADKEFAISSRLLQIVKNRPANSSQKLACAFRVRETVTNEDHSWVRWQTLTGMDETSHYFDRNGLPRSVGEQQGDLRAEVSFAGSPQAATIKVVVAQGPEFVAVKQPDGTTKFLVWQNQPENLVTSGVFDLTRVLTAQTKIQREFRNGKVTFRQDLLRMECLAK